MMEDYFKIAFRNLSRRKLRSWLTIIGIIISVATIFTLVSLSLGLQAAVEEQFEKLGTDKFFIQPKGQLGAPGSGGAVELTINDLEVLEKVQGVKKVSPMITSTAEVENKNLKKYVYAVGIPPGDLDLFFETGGMEIVEGRELRDGDENDILVGSQYRFDNFMGKEIGVGDKLEINGEEFDVKGVVSPVGSPPDDRMVYFTEEKFRDFFNISERVDTITVQINDGEDIEEVAEETREELRKFRDVDEKTEDFSILTPEELLATFGDILIVITVFLVGVAGISLIVGAIGITNTMYTSVLERTKEIGVMKAIGARNSDVLMIFLIESGLLGVVGGVVGILLGAGVSKIVEFIALQELGTDFLRAAFPIYLVVGCLAFAFLTGAISGSLPARKASRVKPVDALHYE